MKPDEQDKKVRVALHLIMPDQVSGPNSGKRLIEASLIARKYEFGFFRQTWLAGGKPNLSLVRDLARQLGEFRPHVVHVSGLQSAGFHAVLAARLASKAKVLVSINGFAGDDTRISAAKRAVFNLIVEPLTLLLCHRFYVVCAEASRRTMVRSFRWKYAGVIHNPAPEISFDIREERSRVRQELGLSDDAYVAIVVGRMVPDKGIDYIAEAAGAEELSGIRWVLVGDGPLHTEFEQRWPGLVADGRVLLTGKVRDAKPLMAAADVFVFGTLHENLSNALLEAMAVGLPAVATRVGGNVEVVEHGVNGLLVEPANARAIVSAINQIQSLSMAERMAWSEAARRTVRTRFSQEELLSRVSDLYDELA